MNAGHDTGPLAPGDLGDCPATSPDSAGFYCTLDAGHSGDHAAHGLDDRPIATWPQQPKAIAGGAS